MEDRGVSPRGQAVDGDRGLPVPGFSHPAQPHSVRITGVESSEGSGLPNRADHLPDQARLAARLPRPTTQESHGSNGSCVSPSEVRASKQPFYCSCPLKLLTYWRKLISAEGTHAKPGVRFLSHGFAEVIRNPVVQWRN